MTYILIKEISLTLVRGAIQLDVLYDPLMSLLKIQSQRERVGGYSSQRFALPASVHPQSRDLTHLPSG